jgi:transposase-like protein
VPIPPEVLEAIAGALGDLTLRDLLGATLTHVARAERARWLAHTPADKGNGSYARGLSVGSLPVEIKVPRTRSGEFRPSLLPDPYQRGYGEETRDLLLGLLASCRSLEAAKQALKKLGLPCPESELEAVAAELIEEMTLRNTRSLDPDLLALFVDGKYVEVRDADRLRPACLYVAVGLGRNGKKRLLACDVRFGRENLEDWKKVLRGLVERGLRRVLIVVQDDFSGLLPVTKGLFPNADIQLCTVHLQRNAKSHLDREDAQEFVSRLRSIKTAWTPEVAASQFDELCDRFQDRYTSFITEVRKKRDHYLAFIQYPESIRRSLSTTNAVEAVNTQLERMRRNNGGYFHSEATLLLKLGITIGYLEARRWERGAAAIYNALDQLNAMFASRFETEE